MVDDFCIKCAFCIKMCILPIFREISGFIARSGAAGQLCAHYIFHGSSNTDAKKGGAKLSVDVLRTELVVVLQRPSQLSCIHGNNL